MNIKKVVVASLVVSGFFFNPLSLRLNPVLQVAQAAPVAKKGGTFVVNIGGEPSSIHPVMSTDAYGRIVKQYVMDTLLDQDPNTGKDVPRLAKSFEVGADLKTFTFDLVEGATFHDGKPVTAEDVKFSFDAIFEDEYQAAHLRPYYSAFERVEVVSPTRVVFHAKEPYFLNLEAAGGMYIMPKHIYGDVKKSKKMIRTLVGSGPYILEKYEQGRRIVLKKNPKAALFQHPYNSDRFNPDRVILRFINDSTVALEMLKKGDIDFAGMTPEDYVQKATGPEWGKTAIKKKVSNDVPRGTGFVGWNLRLPIFQEKKVRQALAHLMNREEMIKKFLFNMSEMARGPIYNQSEFADPSVKAFEFNPTKAAKLLAEAGWKDEDKNGILEKKIDGQTVEMKFTLLFPNKDTEKYLTIYKEDLRKAGIDMSLKLIEWNSFLKLLNSGKFDAVNLAWSSTSPSWDPKQIWHSSSAVEGGSNFIAYKDTEVDEMIDKARVEIDDKKRTQLLRAVYKRIAEDAPYAFLFNAKYLFYGHTPRMQMKADTLRFEIGHNYWWVEKPSAP